MSDKVLKRISNMASNGLSRDDVAVLCGYSNWNSMTKCEKTRYAIREAFTVGTSKLMSDMLAHTKYLALNAQKDADQLNASKYIIDRLDKRVGAVSDGVETVTDDDILASIKIELKG